MTHSIDSYLNISRIEQGKMKYDFVVDDITSIVRKLVDSNKPGAEQKGLKLSMSLSVNALNVKMDRGKITEAINNLLDNAIKYTSNGSVFVAVESLQGRVRISIKDTGIGMSKNTIDTKLFKLFSTAEGSSTINASSSGIGMYISKAHVEACGGKLWAESEGDRKGSTFILEFPLIETDSKAPFPKTVPLPSALEKKT
jgi:signal transduction histidine kinase